MSGKKLVLKKALPILLNYVDLLRQTTAYLSTGADLAPLKQKLEHLRLGVNQTAKRLLLVESSRIMRQLCQEVLSDLGVQLDTYDDGLKALNELLHTRYDCLIIGRQLNSLNGPAVVAALRESDSVNKNIPVLMISTDERQLPEHLKILRLLPRTPALSDVLVIEMEKLMKKRPQIEERSLG
ncbi:MAG: response regulator [Nitrincola sp.]|nr:response regulator [Nitrincola sp.]